jgi:hypothetical protein
VIAAAGCVVAKSVFLATDHQFVWSSARYGESAGKCSTK